MAVRFHQLELTTTKDVTDFSFQVLSDLRTQSGHSSLIG
jgi:hypothetical protein